MNDWILNLLYEYSQVSYLDDIATGVNTKDMSKQEIFEAINEKLSKKTDEKYLLAFPSDVLSEIESDYGFGNSGSGLLGAMSSMFTSKEDAVENILANWQKKSTKDGSTYNWRAERPKTSTMTLEQMLNDFTHGGELNAVAEEVGVSTNGKRRDKVRKISDKGKKNPRRVLEAINTDTLSLIMKYLGIHKVNALGISTTTRDGKIEALLKCIAPEQAPPQTSPQPMVPSPPICQQPLMVQSQSQNAPVPPPQYAPQQTPEPVQQPQQTPPQQFAPPPVQPQYAPQYTQSQPPQSPGETTRNAWMANVSPTIANDINMIADLIEQKWVPAMRCDTEEGYQLDLNGWLRLQGFTTRMERGDVVADIVVQTKDSRVAIEMKKTPRHAQYNRAFGQIVDYCDEFGGAIVVVCDVKAMDEYDVFRDKSARTFGTERVRIMKK